MNATQIIATATGGTAAGAAVVALWKVAAAWTSTSESIKRLADAFEAHLVQHEKERVSNGRF